MTGPRLAGDCVRGLRHRFDPDSGWCVHHACGIRDDGRSQHAPRPPLIDLDDIPDRTAPRRGVNE